jgi:hypothetical protein
LQFRFAFVFVRLYAKGGAMETYRLMKNGHAVFKAALLMGAFLLAAGAPEKPAHTYSEVVTVSCYKGNPNNGTYIGDLTVPAAEDAARGCNSLYADCQGNCDGCFSDSDITEDVCYDKSGKKYLE